MRPTAGPSRATTDGSVPRYFGFSVKETITYKREKSMNRDDVEPEDGE